MFKHFFRNRKIKKYARKLPLELKKSFGQKKFYTKAQVDKALEQRKLTSRDNAGIMAYCYAYAMYCSPKEFRAIHEQVGEVCDYNAMREDISYTLFGSSTDFSFVTLLSEASHSESGLFSGGDSGLDGGGGD